MSELRRIGWSLGVVAVLAAWMGPACSAPKVTGEAVGAHCTAAAECVTQVCTAGACAAATCTDRVQNGDETNVDCGGSCPPCGDGETCSTPSDCQSKVCSTGLCAAPTCTDGVKNGTEGDVDCGGECSRCASGKQCGGDADCASGSCEKGVCAGAGCTDGVKNGNETDVDCGGSCPPCGAGKHCGATADCASLVCTAGACAAASCTDGVKNGDETDVDCGGATCPKCADKLHCAASTDCVNGDCFGSGPGTCVSCTDGVKDGTETDVDCGGSCPACALGKPCTKAADCDQAVCKGGVCTTAQSCKELLAGNTMASTGIYNVDFDGPGGMAPLPVYCDMSTAGGGWTALLNPVMMSLPVSVPGIDTQTNELSGSQTCPSPPPVQPLVVNGLNGLMAYACGNVTFQLTLTWANPIGATDILVLAVAQGDTTHALSVNSNTLAPDAHDSGSNCFAWDGSASPPSAGTGCWKGAVAAPPHAYTGKISGPLQLELSTGPGGMGPNNMSNGNYGTGVSLQQLLVR